MLLVILFIASGTLLLDGFATVEKKDTIRNVKRVIDAFHEIVVNLTIKAADWAKWDDTYTFIENKNNSYISSNLTDETLSELKINLMIFQNTSGEVVYSRFYDPSSEKVQPVDSSFMNIISSDTFFSSLESDDHVHSGFVMTPCGLMAIVCRPILTSEGKGPSHGILIFGKCIDSIEVTRIGTITHLNLSIAAIKNTMQSEFAIVKEKLSYTEIYTKPLNEKRIAGYAYIKDIHDKPVIIARIEIDRDIYRQGYITRIYLLAAIFLSGLVFGVLILFLLQRLVVARVSKLTYDVTEIGDSGKKSLRVRTSGNDELTNLGSSINKMLHALERSELQIRARNKEMRLIMDTIPSGLLSLDEHFVVNPEYSISAERILGKDHLAGKTIFEILDLDGKNPFLHSQLSDFLEILCEARMTDQDLNDLNPVSTFDFLRNNEHRFLSVHFHLIDKGNNIPKNILMVIADSTEEKKLTEKVKISEQENIQLKAIAEDPDLFKEFLSEMNQVTIHAEKKLIELEKNTDKRTLVNEIFSDVHTIKGTAGSFGLTVVAKIAGDLEERLLELRESGEITIPVIYQTRTSLASLSNAITSVVDDTRKILGDDIIGHHDVTVRISIEKLNRELDVIKTLLRNESIDKVAMLRLQERIETQFRYLTTVPAKKGFAKALKILPGLIKKTNKNILFEFTGGEIPIECEVAKELNTPLIHLFRNAIDHGIEPSDVRVQTGKKAEGRVCLDVSEQYNCLVIKISDDGKGLDPDLLKSTAVEKKIITENEASRLTAKEAMELILRPGFSTSTEVTEISGRGVGMDAVVISIRVNLGGNFNIQSEKGNGTTFTIEVPIQQDN
jgi:sensor domain CHASE-containing protein/HPt (histidine-containing phosphotransfer) domain-containing protein